MSLIIMSLSDLKNNTTPETRVLYYVNDIGREGFFRFDVNDTTSANNDGTIIVTSKNARFKRIMIDEGINVKWFGANGDGSDASDAFISAIAFAESMVSANLVGTGNRGNIKIYVPAGVYTISKPEALMRGSFSTASMGLVIQGAGKGITQISYSNQAVSGNYLLYNNDAWMHIVISDIEFTGNSVNAIFMYSYAANNAQNYTFERCVWNGTWKNVFQLEGTDLNSEMTWFHCNFNGSMDNAIYVPYSTDPNVEQNTQAIRSKGSDQFLNYNLYSCQFEVTKGNYLNFEYGGNINVWGGSIIHIGTGTDSAGNATGPGGTLFKLGKTNYLHNNTYDNPDNGHASGTTRFLCIGSRIEHRVQTSILMECNWFSGSIGFISVDNSALDFLVPSYVNVMFDVSNGTPTIKFDGCRLAGKHRFLVNNGSFNHRNNSVMYENTIFTQASLAEDCVVILDNSNGNVPGGRPPVTFRNCRGSGNASVDAFFDSDQGYLVAHRSLLTKKIASIRNGSGKLPRAGQSELFDLPMNALVLNITFFSPAGAVTSTNAAVYTIQTTETKPTVLASINSSNMSAGFNKTVPVMFLCDTNAKRHLQLITGSTVDVNNPKGVILVEYIG